MLFIGGSMQECEGYTENVIARKEDLAVATIRLAMVFVLIACTTGTAVMVFKITRTHEHESMTEHFYDYADKVARAMGFAFAHSLGAVDTFVVSSVSYAAFANMSWPFVTIPNAGIKLAKVRSATKAAIITMVMVVPPEHRDTWDDYSLEHGPGWAAENIKVQKTDPKFHGTNLNESYVLDLIQPLHYFAGPPYNQSMYMPQWHAYPTSSSFASPFNFDLFNIANFPEYPWERQAHLSDFKNPQGASDQFSLWVTDYVGDEYEIGEPASEIYYPIFDDAANEINMEHVSIDNSTMVGAVIVTFFWRDLLEDILPSGIDGVVVVIDNECGNSITFTLNGPEVLFQGFGDSHKQRFSSYEKSMELSHLHRHTKDDTFYTGLPLTGQDCDHTIRVFPSAVFEESYITTKPWLYACATVVIFIFTSIVFGVYDHLVERRQKQVMQTAVKNSAIVSSLFPSNVRSRLYDMNSSNDTTKNETLATQKHRLKAYMNTGHHNSLSSMTTGDTGSIGQPIADLFPEATVMFGDIAGFTAWSSTREPSQRGVFKVETIGDCYVAVVGLPDAKKDHAVVMTKFARDCLARMEVLLAELSVQLGPETEDLSLRVGLNSGPVTAGVLRGQKSRFQLFGDTVNTAARMESSGEPYRIHVSQTTADELIKHGKSHWLEAREEHIQVKGKGDMATYWVDPSERSTSMGFGTGSEPRQASSTNPTKTEVPGSQSKIDRLVAWNVDVSSRLLRAVVERRAREKIVIKKYGEGSRKGFPKYSETTEISNEYDSPQNQKTISLPFNEVQEEIVMLEFNPKQCNVEVSGVVIEPAVTDQLESYITQIAGLYRGFQNQFHNFEHASHVCMSVSKFMARIVEADHTQGGDDFLNDRNKTELYKYQRTFGLSSDPLALFACAFAALIHDADHPGVPNTQLVKEGDALALKYQNRSVAEQRSFDVAWDLWLQDEFRELRSTICETPRELQRFRQLVINGVMATDVLDLEIRKLRTMRWQDTFGPRRNNRESSKPGRDNDNINRKATIVMEHLLQASDVAHTMQHWHIYMKWNQRLFAEMRQAFLSGRTKNDPAEYWYKGEMEFFDDFVIPLAKNLSECGVFGVSGEECLNYALKNREEWEEKGKSIVMKMARESDGAAT
eukprot:Nitzschia sp. Nitz4//scaffold439_size10204//5658//9665//NITZ4_009080-RA/size10204-processed-gene-0.12-mRNA-1//-1//CDS//3329551869//910//frame0